MKGHKSAIEPAPVNIDVETSLSLILISVSFISYKHVSTCIV